MRNWGVVCAASQDITVFNLGVSHYDSLVVSHFNSMGVSHLDSLGISQVL